MRSTRARSPSAQKSADNNSYFRGRNQKSQAQILVHSEDFPIRTGMLLRNTNQESQRWLIAFCSARCPLLPGKRITPGTAKSGDRAPVCRAGSALEIMLPGCLGALFCGGNPAAGRLFLGNGTRLLRGIPCASRSGCARMAGRALSCVAALGRRWVGQGEAE